MTSAEMGRLYDFLEAQQSLGGAAVSHEDCERFIALMQMDPFCDFVEMSCAELGLDLNQYGVEVGRHLAMAFVLGRRWERAEQMRREFGDAEVPR